MARTLVDSLTPIASQQRSIFQSQLIGPKPFKGPYMRKTVLRKSAFFFFVFFFLWRSSLIKMQMISSTKTNRRQKKKNVQIDVKRLKFPNWSAFIFCCSSLLLHILCIDLASNGDILKKKPGCNFTTKDMRQNRLGLCSLAH